MSPARPHLHTSEAITGDLERILAAAVQGGALYRIIEGRLVASRGTEAGWQRGLFRGAVVTFNALRDPAPAAELRPWMPRGW